MVDIQTRSKIKVEPLENSANNSEFVIKNRRIFEIHDGKAKHYVVTGWIKIPSDISKKQGHG